MKDRIRVPADKRADQVHPPILGPWQEKITDRRHKRQDGSLSPREGTKELNTGIKPINWGDTTMSGSRRIAGVLTTAGVFLLLACGSSADYSPTYCPSEGVTSSACVACLQSSCGAEIDALTSACTSDDFACACPSGANQSSCSFSTACSDDGQAYQDCLDVSCASECTVSAAGSLPSGSYAETCTGCSVTGSVLSCAACGDGSGGEESSTLNLPCDTMIQNCLGTLTCTDSCE